MPFMARVPTTEYMIAVNFAPSSLSEPKLRRHPMTAFLNARSDALLSMGTCGLCTKTLPPASVCIWPYEAMYAEEVKASGYLDNDLRRELTLEFFEPESLMLATDPDREGEAIA